MRNHEKKKTAELPYVIVPWNGIVKFFEHSSSDHYYSISLIFKEFDNTTTISLMFKEFDNTVPWYNDAQQFSVFGCY